MNNKNSLPFYLQMILFGLILVFLFVGNFPSLEKAIKNEENITFQESIKEIETDLSSDFIGKNNFINLNGLYSKAIGLRELNQTIRLANNHLSNADDNYIGAITNQVQALSELNHMITNSSDILFTYVQFPTKYNGDSTLLPKGKHNSAQTKINEFLLKLNDNHVDSFDTRTLFQDTDIHFEHFFYTDHHWTVQGAFKAHVAIMDHLSNLMDITTEKAFLDEKNYTLKTYEKWFLGSLGKRVGTYFAPIDDYTFMYPTFETNMEFEVPSKNILRKGSFYDTIFDFSSLEKKDLFNQNPYATYIGGDYPLVTHRNHSALNDKKILILKDSFSLPFQSFLSLHFKQIDVVDLRYYHLISLYDYIINTQPDAVLICYNPSILYRKDMFTFGSYEDAHPKANYISEKDLHHLPQNDSSIFTMPIKPSFFTKVEEKSNIIFSFYLPASTDISTILSAQLTYNLNGYTITKDFDSFFPISENISGLHVGAKLASSIKKEEISPSEGVLTFTLKSNFAEFPSLLKLEISPLPTKLVREKSTEWENLLNDMPSYKINSSTSNYNYVNLHSNFLPNSEYYFEIGDYSFVNDENQNDWIVARLYDREKRETISEFSFSRETDRLTWTFHTPADTQNLSLLLYAGEPNKTRDRAVDIPNLFLAEITQSE